MENIAVQAKAIALVAFLVLASAADADTRCNMTPKGLVACLPSVTGNRPVKPSWECCAALAKADLLCLCKCKGSPMMSQLGIKPQLAMQLPAKCHLRLPRQCKP